VTWYSLVDKYHHEICDLLEAAMSGNSKELPLNAAEYPTTAQISTLWWKPEIVQISICSSTTKTPPPSH